MLWVMCSDGSFNNITNQNAPDNDSLRRICSIIETYRTMRESWEVSAHESVQMIALFLKSMQSYMRCKQAINAHDSWQLEIESCTLMSIWKMLAKITYLKLQCEYIKNFYDGKVPSIYREIKRANAFCVKPSRSAIAFDEEIENYNNLLKKTPSTPSLDVKVIKSHHVMAGDKAGKKMWGIPNRRSLIRGTSLEDDILELEVLMHSASIFISHTAVTIPVTSFGIL